MKLEVLCGSNFDDKHLKKSRDAKEPLHPSSISVDEELGSDGDTACSPSAVTPREGSKPVYARRPKPPLSYIALIAMAIRDSPSGRPTLADINDYLMKNFPFFRGSYTGWKNSVRHNLSLNDCFLKVLRDPSRPWGKDNFWMLNPKSEYTFADGVFRRRRKRIHKKPGVTPDVCARGEPLESVSVSDPSAKFTSSFAIDSILNKPSQRHLNSPSPALGWSPCFQLMDCLSHHACCHLQPNM